MKHSRMYPITLNLYHHLLSIQQLSKHIILFEFIRRFIGVFVVDWMNVDCLCRYLGIEISIW